MTISHNRSAWAAVLGLVGLTTLGAGGSADAYTFSPAKTRFVITGSLGIGAPKGWQERALGGNARTGKSGTNTMDIRTLTFSGQSPLCAVRAVGLPWTVTITGSNTATIANFAFTPSNRNAFGPCGPGPMPIVVSPYGGWNLNGPLPGNCSINGGFLAFTPAIRIGQ